MTQEQKAKRYDRALEIAKAWCKLDNNDLSNDDLETLFPELKESEDDRIRKELLEHCKNQAKPYIQTGNKCPQIQSWIAWLEKQCKQEEPQVYETKDGEVITYSETDGYKFVESTFHEGDWIIHNTANFVFKVINVGSNGYEVVNRENYKKTISFDNEYNYHFWTIKDAKEGDVLAGNKWDVILMFRRIGNTEWDDVIDYHCYYDCYRKNFIVQEDVEHWGNTEDNQLVPATKEQRELLFQKIKEEGYEWNSNKKELKKIEQKPTDKLESKFKVGDWIVNNLSKDVFLIKSFNNGYCTLEDIKGNIISPCLPPCESESHLWTIQDAKEGDIITEDPFKPYPSPFVAIYKKQNEEDFDSHCFIGFNGKFYEGEEGHSIENMHPATKEQRELLFQTMYEAGYEWNSENKELKKFHVIDEGKNDEKIRKALINIFATHKDYEMFFGVFVKDIHAWLEKQQDGKDKFIQQHSLKEDSNVNDETNAPTEYGKYVDECLNEASKHFFSEGEDKYSVADLFYAGVRCGKSWLERQGEYAIACSEEQMKVLNEILNFAANHENPYWNDYIFGTLNNLIRQLKN